MAAIQVSIGALNDIVDAPLDRGRSPVKPVAEGLIQPSTARVVAVAAATFGFGLSALSGPATLVVAALGAACGYLYDVRLSRTPWAWVPLSVALPLVPVYAWLGAVGTVPAGLLLIVPIGMLAGGGLAIGNALVDFGVDSRAGAMSVAVRLGRARAWWLHALALAVAATLATAGLPSTGSRGGIALVVFGTVLLGGGVIALGRAVRSESSRVLRLGWQVEALGVASLGIGWLAALVALNSGAP